MAEIIKMPRLSDTMEEGKVESWNKKVGDKVSYGDILAEIETDKAVQEFETDVEGTLLYIGVEAGQAAPVDSILAIIGAEGEDISGLVSGGGANQSASAQEAVAPAEEPQAEAAPAAEVPGNVTIVSMPRLSDTMEEGKVESWNKKVGDKVSYGDILAEIETDKAVQEFETDVEGTLLYIGVEAGQSAPVDSILAIIGPEGTDVSAIVGGGGAKPAAKAEAPKAEAPKQAAPAQEKKETPAPAAPKAQATNNLGRVFISPLAKKLADEKGYDINQIQGTGDNGRIIKKDVENFTPQTAAAKPAVAGPVALEVGEDTVIPNSQMRKVIAKRLSESKFTAPHYYLTIEVDMDNVMAARKQINQIPNTKVSFNDIVLKATAMAVKKHPVVNSTWKDNEIVQYAAVNIGVAVAVPDGLVVPVVKNTDLKSLSQISAEVKDLATRSRDRKIKADEMEGSTFTVSNLGAYGVESFTSIINQPNSCILSVGAIVEKPVVKNGQIVVGHTMKLCLACDHRTVDGATGSTFLQTLKQYLETPMSMLV
ncbi:pyruvate dehydrogenase complex dihydrolipoamide acetyltransferase [Ornithobacterium rhinotracheale]|uniref:pyruvate dehydrogenase complex dihydrolipoamide acetyltransferase n=1 Tax=Ornithobacterium rhinotracheale TaxID=28251 RepID=UPI00129C15EB|nr:pyruvate dehydrogenase complex dihydrolipoamide acetyltransferase [Ornithobacterium rhinotracheale]MRJ08954.1 pyruvate dehydrogenase complex dihydrolipoamide acetyltransferase [Ornithobacterium rhinotracheale]UOH78853.1 pyruvate dehydrogenase complex dihydrolipoamide acetyltransferase [Ornithobacterium rhinotracheale]